MRVSKLVVEFMGVSASCFVCFHLTEKYVNIQAAILRQMQAVENFFLYLYSPESY